MSPRVLKTEGKFVTVRNSRNGLKLCAVDSQPFENYKYTVTIKKHGDENWIAFTFSVEKESTKDYILQANKSSLELVPLNQPDKVDGYLQSAWFEKDNIAYSEHYSVRATVSPKHYICIEKNTRVASFFLGDNVDARAKVKDEAV